MQEKFEKLCSSFFRIKRMLIFYIKKCITRIMLMKELKRNIKFFNIMNSPAITSLHKRDI